MKLLNKIISNLKEIKTIVICDGLKEEAIEAVFQVLSPHFSVARKIEKLPNTIDILMKDVLVVGSDLKNPEIKEKLKQIFQISKTPVLLVLKNTEGLKDFIQSIPQNTQLIINYDEDTLRKMIPELSQKVLTFGLDIGSDLMASDEQDTNFKINYKGNIVPIWQKGIINKEKIYNILSASCVGIVLGLNLVQISEALKKQ